jgi:methyl-accepting chemotaxis protein
MPLDNTNAEADLKDLTIDLKKATDEVKTFAERVEKEMKNLGAATDETKANADKALTEMNTLGQRLQEVEQKLSRRGHLGNRDLTDQLADDP